MQESSILIAVVSTRRGGGGGGGGDDAIDGGIIEGVMEERGQIDSIDGIESSRIEPGDRVEEVVGRIKSGVESAGQGLFKMSSIAVMVGQSSDEDIAVVTVKG